MAKAGVPVTFAEEREILRLLREGSTALQAGRLVGRSAWVVARIQQAHGLRPGLSGRRSVPSAKSPDLTPDEPEEGGARVADPWIPPVDYDLYGEKPHQRQWLAMLAAANKYEVVNLRHAICRVLNLPLSASDVTIDDTVRADRRLAEELAERYMAARAGRWAA